MRGTVVGVLRGGPSREHEVSLRSGHAVMNALPRERYTVRDIFIDKEGVWHERGIKTNPATVLPSIDVAVIALHGEYGEDGEVQKVLERFGIPYTGSDSFASFVAMHKVMAKEKARGAGLQVPRYTFIEHEEDAEPMVHEVIRTYPQPVIVKAPRWGSSVGVTAPAGYQPVHQAVTGLLNEGAGGALIEEFIRGTEASVGVLENIRGEELYALPAVEIVPPAHESFFTYDAKYSGQSQEIAPGRFSKSVMNELQEYAKRMHQELGLRHYSRSDFIVSPKGIFYLETNTLPGLTAGSLLPKGLASVGINLTQFLEHVIALAMESRKR
ncbi:MAG: D-alanine--D-alanine ligase [Parcubacteria group bacterium]|nr:D-alanine--D-alanine ligase [Parcubacteria group bacterium]